MELWLFPNNWILTKKSTLFTHRHMIAVSGALVGRVYNGGKYTMRPRNTICNICCAWIKRPEFEGHIFPSYMYLSASMTLRTTSTWIESCREIELSESFMIDGEYIAQGCFTPDRVTH